MIQYANRGIPRADLGAAAMEFVMNQADFVAGNVLPELPVQNKSGKIAVVTREGITTEVDAKRAPSGAYNRDSFTAEDLEYACEEFGLEGPLPDERRREYVSDFDAELLTVQTTMRKLLVQRERRVAAAVFNATTWLSSDATLYTDWASSAPWTTAASDAYAHVAAAKEQVRINCGIEPNALICNQTTINRLKQLTVIKAVIAYVERGTDAALFSAISDLFGLPKIIVARATTNSAQEGQTFVGANLWSNLYAMVAVVSDAGPAPTPGIGRTPLWTPDSPSSLVIESYYEPERRQEIYRCRHDVDELIVDKYFGHLMKIALA